MFPFRKKSPSERLTASDRQMVQACKLLVVNYLQEAVNTPSMRSLSIHPEWGIVEPQGKLLVVESNATFDMAGAFQLVNKLETHVAMSMGDVEPPKKYSLRLSLTFSTKAAENKEQTDDRLADVRPIEPDYTMADVVIPDETRKRIMADVQVVANQTLVYDTWGFRSVDPHPHSLVEFYGPPGTGKTMLAHAIAHELGRPFLCFNYADIESKWVGEAAKNLKKAFEMAKESGAVMFFDEADSFLSKRIENGTNGHEQSINSQRSQMLIYLEEHEGLVIFATNLASNIDPAFESRIMDRIHLDLPTREARASILRRLLPAALPLSEPITDDDLLSVADEAEGFSGRELKASVQSMLFRKAAESGANSTFGITDLRNAIVRHKEALEAQKCDKDKHRKEAIREKVKEALMRQNEMAKETTANDEPQE